MRNRKTNTKGIVIFLIAVLFSGFGCARMAVNMAGGPMVSTMIEKVQDMESARLLKDGFAGDLILISALAETSPDNYDLLTQCSFGYLAYALMIEDEDPEYAKDLLAIGKKYGLRALRQNKKFAKGYDDGKKIYELVGDLPKKYTDSLCWTAMNYGFLCILNIDDPTVYVSLADVVSMAKKSAELDNTFYFGAATGFIAAYYALIPKVADPDAGPDSAEKTFNEARALSGGKLLLIDYLEARFLATSVDDRDLFRKRLNHVLSADPSGMKGIRAFNEVAKLKAKYYLENEKKFF